jgi:thiosulfate reductase cytochrome b subunit
MVLDDFPFWLRFAHFINIIFIVLLIRSGIEILSALPKLYWNDHAMPGTEWLKFTRKKMPKDRLWISLEEEESFSPWIALPGRKNLGLGRHWHFFSIIFWILNGAVYYILLFSSNEWQRLVPTDWSIVPQAINNMLMYASFQTPPDGNPYNAIQQLTYFIVVFLLGPFMIATGAAMSPSITARFPLYSKIFRGRQTARSLHFLGMVFFIIFIIIHLVMVTTERFPENMGNMFLGKPTSFGIAVGLFMLVILSVIIVNVWATGVSLNHPRHVQNILGSITDRLQWILFRKISSRQDLERSKVSQFFRINGYPPDTEEYRTISKENFVNYNLEVFGLVEHPLKLSLLDLYNMQKQQQVTEHFCIQGWTAIGEWGGVPVRYILELCKPFQSVRFAVFWSYQYTNNQVFYEVLDIEILKHPQTILAYEMNGETLNIAHGAPLRLRAETQLGYKMVKWIKSIEFVESYENIGMGQGGHREDNMYYGKRAGI